jgi:hypothetical protein
VYNQNQLYKKATSSWRTGKKESRKTITITHKRLASKIHVKFK